MVKTIIINSESKENLITSLILIYLMVTKFIKSKNSKVKNKLNCAISNGGNLRNHLSVQKGKIEKNH